MFGATHFIYYINSHESRFNLFGLLTNTQRLSLVASGGRDPVTFRSLSPTLPATPDMSTTCNII